jgi:hypothetical protein
MKHFQIEKLKWQWLPTVKYPAVYRDHELIRTKTKEEALEAIEFLMSQPKGLTYTITVFKNEEYLTYFLFSMPCLGGLCKYKDSHGDVYSMNPFFPRDIRVAFPEGDIIFIGLHKQNLKNIINIPYFQFIFSNESPWKDAFGSPESIILKDNYLVLTNMDTDPTVFYSLCRMGDVLYGGATNNVDPKITILLNKTSQADPRRLAGQKPIKISGGTWAQGFGYTRCFNESIFKYSLPDKLENFIKYNAGYPQAPHSNDYFIKEMKSKFGIDINLGLILKVSQDKVLHDTLVKSWDYFKEESKNLGSGFPE